ncbi:MAG: hypothetical protein ACK5LG_22205 [Bacteroides thetaiotaomicron]
MRKVTVKWLGPCPNCHSRKLSVVTASENNSFFSDEEKVHCDKCGKEGEIQSVEEGAYVSWEKH